MSSLSSLPVTLGSVNLFPTTHIPERRRPIVIVGSSGYVKPHDIIITTGYYDDEYRPNSPWLDECGECLTNDAVIPYFWCYRKDLLHPNDLELILRLSLPPTPPAQPNPTVNEFLKAIEKLGPAAFQELWAKMGARLGQNTDSINPLDGNGDKL